MVLTAVGVVVVVVVVVELFLSAVTIPLAVGEEVLYDEILMEMREELVQE